MAADGAGGLLEASWHSLGRSWWGSRGRRETILGRLGAILGCLGAVPRPSWGLLGGPAGRPRGFAQDVIEVGVGALRGTYLFIHVYMCMYVRLHVYVCAYIHIHIYIYIHIHVYMQIYRSHDRGRERERAR